MTIPLSNTDIKIWTRMFERSVVWLLIIILLMLKCLTCPLLRLLCYELSFRNQWDAVGLGFGVLYVNVAIQVWYSLKGEIVNAVGRWDYAVSRIQGSSLVLCMCMVKCKWCFKNPFKTGIRNQNNTPPGVLGQLRKEIFQTLLLM